MAEVNSKPKPRVVDDDEMGPELLASEIKKISDAAKELLSSKLSRRCILVLLNDATGISKRDIGEVLDAAADLEKTYTLANERAP